jgi:hypothetical protein
MSDRADRAVRISDNADILRPLLTAIILIIAGLSLMEWDDSHDQTTVNPLMTTSQAR